MATDKLKILCVDDEPRVVSGLERNLRDSFQVLTATSGAEGIARLTQNADIAIVMSDMRMPEMDGATFLKHTHKLRPDAVRLLLTGHADIQSAIAAVNKAQVYRFLTKPCPPDELAATFAEARRQYELVTAERTLLHRTLVGSVKALVEVMSWSNPDAMGRAVRLRRRVVAMAELLQMERRWVVESAALFSEIGTLSLPETLAAKVTRGLPLQGQERQQARSAQRAAIQVIAQIPRLEPVAELLEQAFGSAAGEDSQAVGQPPPDLAVQLLQIGRELDRNERANRGNTVVVTERLSGKYSPAVLEAAQQTAAPANEQRGRLQVAADQLKIGMILDEDVQTDLGLLIAPRGIEVTESFLEHIARFTKSLGAKPILVLPAPLLRHAAVA